MCAAPAPPLAAGPKDDKKTDSKTEGAAASGGPAKRAPVEMPPYEFLTELPPISAQDLYVRPANGWAQRGSERAADSVSALRPGVARWRCARHRDVIKLTAQFVARNGRAFMNTLAQKEARNYQFDFLRPTHSLFPLFNRLVEEYTKVLAPPKPTRDFLASVLQNKLKVCPAPGCAPDADRIRCTHCGRSVYARAAVDTKQILERASQRQEWEEHLAKERKKAEDDAEAERSASCGRKALGSCRRGAQAHRGSYRVAWTGSRTSCVPQHRLERFCDRRPDRVHGRTGRGAPAAAAQPRGRDEPVTHAAGAPHRANRAGDRGGGGRKACGGRRRRGGDGHGGAAPASSG